MRCFGYSVRESIVQVRCTPHPRLAFPLSPSHSLLSSRENHEFRNVVGILCSVPGHIADGVLDNLSNIRLRALVRSTSQQLCALMKTRCFAFSFFDVCYFLHCIRFPLLPLLCLRKPSHKTVLCFCDLSLGSTLREILCAEKLPSPHGILRPAVRFTPSRPWM